jgi:hypothetical protein
MNAAALDCFALLAMTTLALGRHCEERSDEAIHAASASCDDGLLRLRLAMTAKRHCEERSDEAIHTAAPFADGLLRLRLAMTASSSRCRGLLRSASNDGGI